jgi:hypothetical protein
MFSLVSSKFLAMRNITLYSAVYRRQGEGLAKLKIAAVVPSSTFNLARLLIRLLRYLHV